MLRRILKLFRQQKEKKYIAILTFDDLMKIRELTQNREDHELLFNKIDKILNKI